MASWLLKWVKSRGIKGLKPTDQVGIKPMHQGDKDYEAGGI